MNSKNTIPSTSAPAVRADVRILTDDDIHWFNEGTHFDLQSKSTTADAGGNWTTSVKNQGSCGSCVAFATCGTIESRIEIACKNADMEPP